MTESTNPTGPTPAPNPNPKFKPVPSLQTVLDAGCDLSQHPFAETLLGDALIQIDPNKPGISGPLSETHIWSTFLPVSRRHRNEFDKLMRGYLKKLLAGCDERCICESDEDHRALLAFESWRADLNRDRSLMRRVIDVLPDSWLQPNEHVRHCRDEDNCGRDHGEASEHYDSSDDDNWGGAM